VIDTRAMLRLFLSGFGSGLRVSAGLYVVCYWNFIEMAIYDPTRGGYRIFIGDLGRRAGKVELEREFERFGTISDVWVAR
jgi:hypothetical protein